MTEWLWSLAVLTLFYLAVQLSLRGRSAEDIDEATQLPFADDPYLQQRMRWQASREREHGKERR
ncbi:MULTISPECIES: hypothetical protein [Pseudomonas]|uniref:hypothetical protein n=1 Tax=Pseudomonas TaxID=286 RepID=UPI00249B16F0|nr:MULTISPECIES: hypothetical protein [Pseudomonas]